MPDPLSDADGQLRAGADGVGEAAATTYTTSEGGETS
jgi:hypothetical protein